MMTEAIMMWETLYKYNFMIQKARQPEAQTYCCSKDLFGSFNYGVAVIGRYKK